MSSEQYADLARRFVRQEWVEPMPRPPADRRQLVGAVEQALRGRSRRLAAVRWSAGVGSVAAAAAAALLLLPRLGGMTHGPAQQPLAHGNAGSATVDPRAFTVQSETADADLGIAIAVRGMAVEAGMELSATETDDVRIGTMEGTALTLEAGGRMMVSESGATQRFTLREGAVRAKVAKLHAGQRFLINTSDAEIEVHGTAFRVAVAGVAPTCAGASPTRVSVTEGVVTVRSGGTEARLFPGDEWARLCPTVTAPEAPRRAVLHASSRGHARVGRMAAASAPETPELVRRTGPVSALDAQNDLFEAGVRAKQEGHLGEAVRLFTWLAWQYPNGPLVESALVQRMKTLAKLDVRAASAAATEYLARFPGGFARGEARTIAGAAAHP